MFSLTTLPVHCIYRRDVTDISYPRNIASKADTYLAILLLVRKLTMLRDRDTEALWSPLHTAMLQQDVLAKSLDKQTIWNYLQYYCLLNLTLPWRWELWRNNVILSVRVLVKAVVVKPLEVINTEITVFSVTPCSSADGVRSQRIVTGRGQGMGLWQFVLTPRLGLEV